MIESINLILWGVSLGIGLVVTLVALVLLLIIIGDAKTIHFAVSKIWDTGQKVANNTIHIPILQKTSDNLEKTLIKSNKHLNSYTRGTVGLSSVSLIWNSKIFGKLKNKRVINLKEGDQRPCLIIETVKGYQLIAAHFPWIDYKRQLNNNHYH